MLKIALLTYFYFLTFALPNLTYDSYKKWIVRKSNVVLFFTVAYHAYSRLGTFIRRIKDYPAGAGNRKKLL